MALINLRALVIKWKPWYGIGAPLDELPPQVRGSPNSVDGDRTSLERQMKVAQSYVCVPREPLPPPGSCPDD